MDPTPDAPPFASILIPVDGTPASEIAVRRSDRLLAFPGARVTLLTVTGERSSVNAGQERRIESLVADLKGSGISARAIRRTGIPAREILREIEAGGHDLVVLSSRRRSFVDRLRPGLIVCRLLKRSPVPLLLFRPLCGLDEPFFAVHRSEPAAFRRVLVMLDGSAEAERILPAAMKIARTFESELILFHSLEPRRFSDVRMEPVRAYLSGVAASANEQGIAARIQICVGRAPLEALRQLDRTADTLAFTTHGHSLWRTAFAGSAASHLLHVAEGPLLCLPSPSPARGSYPLAPSRRSAERPPAGVT
jgi:nucleotide-binding universal stress UspA family protein